VVAFGLGAEVLAVRLARASGGGPAKVRTEGALFSCPCKASYRLG
jgi:hypothetical protein